MPISVATHGPFVYALNGGGVNNISGFWITWWGKLVDIPGSAQPLSANSPGPAQVEFSPDGDHLVVTEKGTNLILTYKVNRFGRSSAPETHTSSGMTPFGFAFAGRHTLIVSEAFGGAPDASAASSYRFRHSGLDVITGSAGTTETAACWTVVTRNGRFAYVTNTGSGTVSGYRIGSHGQLTLLDGDGVTGVTGVGSAPADAAMDSNSRFLYTRNGGDQTISIFRISPDGSLTPLPGVTGLPATAVGLAAN
jgi:6-phosphogluconolactonase (cycloisomerase 2 family)